jgi:ATP-dependent exoDNAse (exonuclease V) beta subunit
MFKLDLIDLPSLVRIDGESRHYETPTGEKYPSVTTVLSKTKDQTHLIAWRKRIGEDAAAKITAQAGRRGTATHLLCEKFVLNEPINLRDEMPLSVHLFTQLQKVLVGNVDNIRSSEGRLFSHKLKVAGSVDLIANWRNHAAIIDFKTSRAYKRADWIEDYFLQCAMYSYMFWEMTKLYHPKLVVAIAVEEENEPQVFEEDVNDWIDKAKDRCRKYHSAK